MTAVSEVVAPAAQGGPVLGSVMVRDLRAGMTIVVPSHAASLVWRLVALPVPVSSDASMVLLRRVVEGRVVGVPVALGFFQTLVVDLVPEHDGFPSPQVSIVRGGRCAASTPASCADPAALPSAPVAGVSA